MHVVVIDADATATFLLGRTLQREPAVSSAAFFQFPAQAVNYLQQQAAQGTLPAVLLLSLYRPLQSGWDALDALNPLAPLLSGHCRVYVLSSAIWAGEDAHIRRHPLVTGVLQKPLDATKLQQLFRPVPHRRI